VTGRDSRHACSPRQRRGTSVLLNACCSCPRLAEAIVHKLQSHGDQSAPNAGLFAEVSTAWGARASGRRVVALWKHRCALKENCKSLRDELSSPRPAELCSPASGCCSRRRSRALRCGSQAEIRYHHGAIVKTLSFFLQVSGTAEGGAGGFRQRCGLQATMLLCRGRIP